MLPALLLGDAPMTNVEATLRLGKSAYLGMNALEQFRITLSPSDKKIFLEERPGFKPRLFGTTGIFLQEGKNGTFVIQSAPDPPAGEKAPIRIGDRLLAIDGTDITGKPAWQVARLLYGYEGTPFRLTVQSGTAAPRTLTRSALNRYTAPPK